VTDEEWKKFSSNFPKSGSSAPQSIGGQVWSGVKGVAEGAAKEVGSVIDPKTELTKDVPDYYGGLREWSESKDPAHPYTEPAGRLGADLGTAALTPDLPGIAALAKGAARWTPRIARYGEKLVQDTWKGAVGGAEQNPEDRKEGAGTGAVGGAALGALPSVPRGLLPAAAAATLAGGSHHFGPWMLYHVISPLAGLAAALQRMGPGPAGALLEKTDRARLHEGGQSDDWSPSKGNQ
jgi:hypothetical protein